MKHGSELFLDDENRDFKTHAQFDRVGAGIGIYDNPFDEPKCAVDFGPLACSLPTMPKTEIRDEKRQHPVINNWLA